MGSLEKWRKKKNGLFSDLRMWMISEAIARCEKHRTITRRDSATKIYMAVSRVRNDRNMVECNSARTVDCAFSHILHIIRIVSVDFREENRKPGAKPAPATVYKRQITQKRRHFDKSSSKDIWHMADTARKSSF